MKKVTKVNTGKNRGGVSVSRYRRAQNKDGKWAGRDEGRRWEQKCVRFRDVVEVIERRVE